MKYSNAIDGVKKIYIAEIIALIASIIMIICSVLGLVSFENEELVILTGVTGMIVFVALGFYVAAYILQIVGIVRAKRDEPAFKVSLYAIIAMLVLTILESLFYGNPFMEFILELARDAAQFFMVHYIIHGIMHLSEHLGRPDMTKKGHRIFWVVYSALAFEIVVRIFQMIFGREVGESMAMPFGIAANVLKTLEYFLFLIYVGKGNRILQDYKKQYQAE